MRETVLVSTPISETFNHFQVEILISRNGYGLNRRQDNMK